MRVPIAREQPSQGEGKRYILFWSKRASGFTNFSLDLTYLLHGGNTYYTPYHAGSFLCLFKRLDFRPVPLHFGQVAKQPMFLAESYR